MSKLPPLRCLFCDHRNLASARFCNDCASPLHLQPCKECGAIDKRTATNCYKCGAQFSVTAAPKGASVAAAPKRAPKAAASKHANVPTTPELAGAPAAPAPESDPVPPLSRNPLAKPLLSDGGVAIERAFLSESPPQVIGMFRQGLRRELTETETQVQAAAVVDRDPMVLNPDAAHASAEVRAIGIPAAPESISNPDFAHSTVEPQEIGIAPAPEHIQDPDLAHLVIEPRPRDETIESESAATTAPRRARRIAVLTLLLAIAGASYYYYDRSLQQLAQGRSAGQPVASVPDGPIAADATPAAATTQGDASSAPKETASQPMTRPGEVEKAASPSAARRAVKSRTDPQPAPADDALADPASASRPPAMTQAAGSAASVRAPSGIDAGTKTRQDPSRIRECTEAIAALGLCSPNKPQGDK